MVGEILVSVEMIGESVNLVLVEHLRAKIETARIVERRHCALITREDAREEVQIEVPFEKGTELLKERLRPRQLRNAERSLYLSKLNMLGKRFLVAFHSHLF